MYRAAHHRHRIVQGLAQRGESTGRDLVIGRLGHGPAGLRLHDRTSQQVPHIVVDLAGDTRAFAERRHADRLRALLIDIGDARADGTGGFTGHILSVQQRTPIPIRSLAGPSRNESEQRGQRKSQRLHMAVGICGSGRDTGM